jgi:protein-L-isoaspartate(D-aspartate) O-methyltransferase
MADARSSLLATLRAQGIVDEAVLAAMARVPRERFVLTRDADYAYENTALPIGRSQTISQPYVVAAMTQALTIRPGDRVLEVGTGSGYQAAVLTELGARLVSIERHAGLLDRARATLHELGYDNIELVHGDGMLGMVDRAPFDAIIVTAGGERVPPSLTEQLADGGRLIMPVGSAGRQELLLLTRDGDRLIERRLGAVRFVPLLPGLPIEEE